MNLKEIKKPTKEEIQAELEKRYDTSKDVWTFTSPEPDEKFCLDKADEHRRVSTALISLRAEESLDRRVILSQGEYSTGEYSNNQGSNICSPVFDYTTADIWRLLSATDWDVNDVYEKLYEIGVGIGDQRVGSLLNYAAVRQIGTVKALEPDLYARINARFQNVEFMSQFSRRGYFKIGKPKNAFWDGQNHLKAGVTEEKTKELSDKYEELLKFIIPCCDYERIDNLFKPSKESENYGKPWKPFNDFLKFFNKIGEADEKKLSYYGFNNFDKNSEEFKQRKEDLSNKLNEINKLNNIHTTWKDYALVMLNSTAEPLRSIWREKIVTSIIHWTFNKGSISEENIIGLEVMSSLPDSFTEQVVDEHWNFGEWYKLERLNGSKRMNVHLGQYPMESLSNSAALCLKYITNNFNKPDGKPNWDMRNLIFKNKYLREMWDFAQKSGGDCVSGDEILTYLLEKPIKDDERRDFTTETAYPTWINMADDIFKNGIPSDKYKKYYKSNKIEGYPLAEYVENDNETGNWFRRIENSNETVELSTETIPIEEQIENFMKVVNVILKEDVSYSPCWKKICICILKNDVTMKYAGFGATLRERIAREDAIAAFSTKQKEKEEAKANAKALAAKIEAENKENASA